MKTYFILFFILIGHYLMGQSETEIKRIQWNVFVSNATLENESAQFSDDSPAPSFMEKRIAPGLDILGFYSVGDRSFYVGSGISAYASFFRGDLSRNGETIPGEVIEDFDALKLSIPLLARYDFNLSERTSLSFNAGPALTTYHVHNFRNTGILPSIVSYDYVTGLKDGDGLADTD